jgi:magnesium-transporting ATPase (P-type)
VAASISILLGERDDALFIFIVLAINTAIGSFQEWKAEATRLRSGPSSVPPLAFCAMVECKSCRVPKSCRATLWCSRRETASPADLRILDAADLETDESALTGESLPVVKSAGDALPYQTMIAERSNMLHAGSTVQRGRARAVVVATGLATVIGQIAEVLHQPGAVPPLTRRLDRFTRNLGLASIVIVGAVVGLELLQGHPFRESR